MFNWLNKFAQPNVAATLEEDAMQSSTKLREPVQVLIDSLGEGWWDFKCYGVQGCRAKHEWLGTTLTFYIGWSHREQWSILGEDWMTEQEKKLVAETALLVKKKMDARVKLRDDKNREIQFFKLLDLKENA